MKISIARVYIGGGRRYFTLKAACRAEARQRIRDRYDSHGAPLSDYGKRLINRYARLLEREHRRITP